MTNNKSSAKFRKLHAANASMIPEKWLGKPYYSLDAYCKNTFGRKCYKIALNAHMTCPNRDGTLDTRGCIFCSQGGSGDFAVDALGSGGIAAQLQRGFSLIQDKLPLSDGEISFHPCIIAYFQAYTNTYAPLPYLKQIFTEALETSFVLGISIATRPDCLPPEILALLSSLKESYPHKFIWIELGLQTTQEKTAAFIRRGYPLLCFEQAVKNLQAIDIPVITHVILGLPGELPTQMLETINYLNTLKPFGIKLQLLHILEGTDLAILYRKGEFSVLTETEYLDILITCLEHLSPDIVVHRVTGDGPKKILIAPKWSGNKRKVLNTLHYLMREKNTWQGRCFSKLQG